MKIASICIAAVLLIAGGISQAEPTLAGPGGALDYMYGLDNLIEITGGMDQVWHNPGTVTITAQAAWSSYGQYIGYLPGNTGGSFHPLYWVSRNGFLDGPTATLSVDDTGQLFRWADNPSHAPLWSSLDSDNSDQQDHMRTFFITGGPSAGSYAIGWEDLPCLGDRDYQDVVLEVSGAGGPVPEPASAALMLLGLAAALRRRRKV